MEITFDLPPALVVGFVVSTLLPLLVGLVTKVNTSAGVKAVLLAALAALTGLGTELLASINAGTPYDLGAGLILAITAFITGVALHFGLWKPVGASQALQQVGSQ